MSKTLEEAKALVARLEAAEKAEAMAAQERHADDVIGAADEAAEKRGGFATSYVMNADLPSLIEVTQRRLAQARAAGDQEAIRTQKAILGKLTVTALGRGLAHR